MKPKSIIKLTILMVAFIFLFSCVGSKKTTLPTPQSKALDALVAKKSFLIVSDRATPMASNSMSALGNSGLLGYGNTASNINLIGNSNYLKIEGDTISADLPYYGERQLGGGYTAENGIKFKGVPKDYSLAKDETTQQYTIKFLTRGEGTESFNVIIRLFPNWNSTISVTSSQRTTIGYQGAVEELE